MENINRLFMLECTYLEISVLSSTDVHMDLHSNPASEMYATFLYKIYNIQPSNAFCIVLKVV